MTKEEKEKERQLLLKNAKYSKMIGILWMKIADDWKNKAIKK